MPLFRSSPKNPQELVKGLRDALTALDSGAKKADKAAEEAAKLLGQIKVSRALPLSYHQIKRQILAYINA